MLQDSLVPRGLKNKTKQTKQKPKQIADLVTNVKG